MKDSMKCPSCHNPLEAFEAASVQAWVCRGGCGGFWLDRYELKKIQPEDYFSASALLRLQRAAGVRIFRNAHHVCPRCQNTLLFRHFFSKKLDVEVDQCGKCGGFWIEAGKLISFYGDSPNPDRWRETVVDYLARIFDERISRMDVTNPEVLKAAQELVRIFRFISPAEFLPPHPPWWVVD